MEIPSRNGRFYPVPFKKEQLKAKKYFKLFKNFSIGRAGTYRYEVDIDDYIASNTNKKLVQNNEWNGPVIGEELKLNKKILITGVNSIRSRHF